MKNIIKLFFAAAFIFCSIIFSSMYMMQSTVADSYKITRGEEFSIDTKVPVTAKYNGAKMSQGNQKYVVGEKFDVDLKIFGIIPYSTVSVQIVDRMYVQVLGNPFGMKIYTDGVLVVEATDVKTTRGNCNPAIDAGIKIGDYIKSVNGKTVTTNEELSQIILESGGNSVRVEILRKGKTLHYDLTPALDSESGFYRLGIWVRDSSAGIGTLTFYSPSNDVVCGLGHGICDSDTETLLNVQQGELVGASIVDIEKGSAGNPGALKGKFTYECIADIKLNSECGVYGFSKKEMFSQELTEIALKQQVRNGNAQILCTTDGETPKLYSCRIEKCGSNKAKTQNLLVTVTDSELIKSTGGIVQGMSGSPILQDGKLVGALTHVLVSDSLTGYGVYAENMLETAEKVARDYELQQAS